MLNEEKSYVGAVIKETPADLNYETGSLILFSTLIYFQLMNAILNMTLTTSSFLCI